MKSMSIQQIIEENTGIAVVKMEYENSSIETYIAKMADGRTYYANSEWAGFVNDSVEDLIAEIETGEASEI